MPKKYIVRLTTEERECLDQVIKQLSGSSQKVRRAWILLKSDADGPGWTDQRICEAYGCRLSTVEKLRKRFVEEGFALTLNGKPKSRTRPKTLDGEQEAKLIALRLGPPPAGYANWSLRLLADQMVALELVDSISHVTVSKTLKKIKLLVAESNTG